VARVSGGSAAGPIRCPSIPYVGPRWFSRRRFPPMSTDPERLEYPVPRTEPGNYPAEYERLRSSAPVCPITLATGDPALLVTRHEHVKTVLADRRFSRAAMCGPDSARYQEVRPFPDSILGMDPPRHTRIRKFAAQAFTARRIEQVRPRIAAVAEELLAEMATMTGPVDLNETFTRPLPLKIICEMLGIPYAEHAMFVEWTRTIMWLTTPADELVKTYLDMRAYFADLLVDKRKNPTEDVLSTLATATDENGGLTDAEWISLGSFLLVSGHDTSVTVLADSTLTLLRNPDQLALLRSSPALWPNAVEELLRLTNPGGSIFPRVATADVQLGDATIPQGATVVAHIGSGCRDESVVPDPERFDVRRDVGFQIFFGHGPHFCLGAALGRAEMEIGLRLLFDRFPTLELAVPAADLRWKDLNALGGWETFPVRWT
jgi:cytochrome P450